MTGTSSVFVDPKDGSTWDDCDSPVSPIGTTHSSSVSRSEHVDRRAESTNLQTVLESCGQLMLSLSKGDVVQDPQLLLALEQSMCGVSRQLRTPLNRARPINRLPPEVLSTIFRLAAGPIKTTDLRNVIRLSSICRYWRTIILEHGAMWSNIRLTGQNPSFVAQQVERCRGVPLHLSIDIPHTLFRVEGAPFLACFKQVAPIIRARRSQVRSISAIIGGCRAFRRDLGLDWPNLEELEWVDVCPTGSRMHEPDPPVPDVDHRTPKLRHLSARQGIIWEMTSITPLTAVKLEGPMNIDIFKFLQATPHLESLELIKLHVHPSPINATSIDLPRLTKLVMRNVEYGQLFVRVTFPSLINLTVDPVEYQEPPTEIVWGRFLVPAAITTLEIHYSTYHRHHKIFVTGSDETKTRSLNLSEHAAPRRSVLMIQALCHASLASVTSLSIGRGAPEGAQLPSTQICALISELPHLRRLDLSPSRFSLTAMKYLRSHPLICPELRVLSLAVVREICEEAFELLSGLVLHRAESKRWIHRIDCVMLRVGGNSVETNDLWDSMSRHRKLEEYLQCNVGEEGTCRHSPGPEMYPTERVAFRYSYYLGRYYRRSGSIYSRAGRVPCT